MKQTKTIGILIPDLLNPYWASFVHGVDDVIRTFGNSSMLCNYSNDIQLEKELLWLLKYRQVDGIVHVASGHNEKEIKSALEQKTKILLVGGPYYPNLATNKLGIANNQGGYDATKHLHSLGHTQIAVIGAMDSIPSSNLRINGYQKFLKEIGVGIKNEWIIESGEYRFEEGYKSMKQLLCLENRPTAVFVVNDVMAIGAISAIHDRGLSVPNDIAVIGFDGVDIGSWFHPRLTTLEVHPYEFGHKAANMLIESFELKEDTFIEDIFIPKLLIRESCGANKVTREMDCPD